MRYWATVIARAWRETRAEVRWDTPVRLAISVGSPLAAGAATWLASQQFAWGVMASFSVLVMLAGATFLTKLIAVPITIDREQTSAVSVLKALVEPIDPVPDMSIRELFFHIDKDILDNDRWETADIDVRDALALGRLKCWGRKVRDDILRRELSALQEIDKKFWERGSFTYDFFEDGRESRTHAIGRDDVFRLEYADLRVNRAQVQGIWPR